MLRLVGHVNDITGQPVIPIPFHFRTLVLLQLLIYNPAACPTLRFRLVEEQGGKIDKFPSPKLFLCDWIQVGA